MKIDILYKNGHSEIIDVPKDFTEEMFEGLVSLVETSFNSNTGTGYFNLSQKELLADIKTYSISDYYKIKH